MQMFSARQRERESSFKSGKALSKVDKPNTSIYPDFFLLTDQKNKKMNCISNSNASELFFIMPPLN